MPIFQESKDYNVYIFVFPKKFGLEREMGENQEVGHLSWLRTSEIFGGLSGSTFSV